jgi:hypothetical protein
VAFVLNIWVNNVLVWLCIFLECQDFAAS